MTPKIIYIETTNLCNAQCIMCPHEKITRQPNIMSDDIFYKAIEDCKNMNLKNNQIFLHKEGEPLLDPNIIKRINYVAKEFSQYNEVGISTNAMLLNKEKSKQIINSGINLLFFSVDGENKEEYEKIRLQLNYDIVKENIEFFFNQYMKGNTKIRIVMQMLTTEDDNRRAKQFIKNWKQYPCEFYIKRMHSYLDGGNSSLSSSLSNIQINTCKDPFNIAVVYTNGNVGLCCWDYNNEYSLGNIMDYDIYSLFNGKKAEVLRKILLEKKGSRVIPCNRCARIFGQDKISSY